MLRHCERVLWEQAFTYRWGATANARLGASKSAIGQKKIAMAEQGFFRHHEDQKQFTRPKYDFISKKSNSLSI
jgi:hypothetical protein